LFHNTGLALYPRPQFIVFDNGNKGELNLEFKQMCMHNNYALKPNNLQVTTIHAQTNAIIEPVHKVVNEMLRSFDLKNNHENLEEQQ
jgi:hypothetical protein